MINKVKGVFKNGKITKYIVMLISFGFVGVLSIVLSLVFSNATLAYSVQYDGDVIAQVSSQQVLSSAEKIAAQGIVAENPEEYISDSKLSLTLTLPERINNSQQTADAILANTASLSEGAALVVDGEQVAFAKDSATLQSALDKKLSQYNIEGYENKSEFVQKVEIAKVYCPAGKYTTEKDLLATIDGLSVKTTAKITQDVTVPFSTVTKKNASKLVGYYQVSQKGVNGINHTVEQVVYIDGAESERIKLEQEVVKEPVDEIVVVGTASAPAEESSSMVFPIPKASNYLITTYFGEVDGNHVHKGLDYAVAYGTNIYAVKGGTVVTAGYKSDYGYYVVINHGNGVRTLYAHCSKLLVKQGEEVTQGQIIALVGSTGWSTGNHLHFEIIINGRYVDPLLYV